MPDFQPARRPVARITQEHLRQSLNLQNRFVPGGSPFGGPPSQPLLSQSLDFLDIDDASMTPQTEGEGEVVRPMHVNDFSASGVRLHGPSARFPLPHLPERRDPDSDQSNSDNEFGT